MPVPQFGQLDGNASYEQLRNYVYEMQEMLQWLLKNLDSLNIKSLTADKVITGTLDAGKVTVRVDYNSGAYVEIGPNGVTINNGTIDTFSADTDGEVTATSITIQTASAYPKVVIDPFENLLKIMMSATRYIRVIPLEGGTNAPALQLIDDDNGKSAIFYLNSLGFNIIGGTGTDVNISGDNIRLLGKVIAQDGTSGTFYVSTTPGGPTDTAITFDDGIKK